MARLYSKGNDLTNQYLDAKRKRNLSVLGIACVMLFWILCGYFHLTNFFIFFLFLVGIGGFGLSINSFNAKTIVLQAGLEGENAAKNLLSSLSDDYSVITNAKIKFDGKISEIDSIIVGTNGVFIVEIKNHNGYIFGSCLGDKLTQDKIGRGGTAYSSSFYNPVKQVKTHIYRLSNYLKENGVNAWIQGAVYFSNPNANIDVCDQTRDAPVFSNSAVGDKRLLHFIENYKSRHPLSDADKNKIIQLVLK